MSRARRLLPAAVCLLAAVSCSRAPEGPQYQTTATVKDLMDSIVDPSADGIWDSVEIVATLDGIEKKEPKTDDDWKALRRHAIALVEVGNLLVMPGRRIAQAGEKADDPRVDLHPEEIEQRVADDPATWARHAQGLHNAAMLSLDAIDKRDVAALLDAGDDLDAACENCHREYWYRDAPNGAVPLEAEVPAPEGTPPAAPAAGHAAASDAHAAASDAVSMSAPGTIRGHVAFAGTPPGNPVIRMGMDPKCAELNAGKQVLQEAAVVAADGSVANAFVSLEGSFAPTPVPTGPVVIDQRDCVYGPRVVGVRVGQPLRVVNDDDLLHNVHASSSVSNSFNVAQPGKGAIYEFTPRQDERMVKIGCDIHRWMTAWVGVVSHPYFAVSGRDGSFEIRNVPPGTYTISSWHETFGETKQDVTVPPGGTATVQVTFGPAS
jgi:plastocyanin